MTECLPTIKPWDWSLPLCKTSVRMLAYSSSPFESRQEEKFKVILSYIKSFGSSWLTNKLNYKISMAKTAKVCFLLTWPCPVQVSWMPFQPYYWSQTSVPVITLKLLIIWLSGKEEWWILQGQPHILLWKGPLTGQKYWHDLAQLSVSQEDQFYPEMGRVRNAQYRNDVLIITAILKLISLDWMFSCPPFIS